MKQKIEGDVAMWRCFNIGKFIAGFEKEGFNDEPKMENIYTFYHLSVS